MAGACLYLTFNRHSKTNYQDYHSFIWADAAGYYSYLPGLFIYGFDSDKYPENIREKTGGGYREYEGTSRMFTKYSCGVAILQAPFFLIAHGIAHLTDYQANGFSPPYHYLLMISANFYLFLGLLLLKNLLLRYYSLKSVLIALFLMVAGTNLFYYVVDDGGYSHIYSFFLFALFMWNSVSYMENRSPGKAMVLGGILGLITLIRPTNIIIVLFLLFFRKEKRENSLRLVGERLLKPLNLLGMLLFFTIPFIPQLVYWKFITGEFLVYAYEGEGFSNLLSPPLHKVWFSTLNGLFPYSLIALFMVAGIIRMVWEKVINAWFYLFLFLLSSYIFASWWMWYFGCSFGARSFVEFYALFAFPLTFLIRDILKMKSNLLRIFLVSLMVILSVLNLFLTYHFDECWYGGEWDWNNYFDLII